MGRPSLLAAFFATLLRGVRTPCKRKESELGYRSARDFCRVIGALSGLDGSRVARRAHQAQEPDGSADPDGVLILRCEGKHQIRPRPGTIPLWADGVETAPRLHDDSGFPLSFET